MEAQPWLCLLFVNYAGALLLPSMSNEGLVPVAVENLENDTMLVAGAVRGSALGPDASAGAAPRSSPLEVGRLDYHAYGFHIDDVGVYVSTRSELWGAKNITRDKFMDRFLGHVTLRYRLMSKYWSRSLWKKYLNGVAFRHQLDAAGCIDSKSDSKEDEVRMMDELISDGPKFHLGALLEFQLDEDGMAYSFQGQYVSKRGTACSCITTMESFIGKETVSTGFKKAIFSTLEAGVAAQPTQVFSAHVGKPGVFW
eukprot:CAMPEP_0171291888 /NCGR_PEP_ID=MMETSP0790-20130122/71879_1 /TAXON_ID=2925 /ORGANISM="Alexandrium catenella, Strain OF101" /LENGTH=253 /DNA_ID=CAMNT_0011761615 /DNA_START=15 /DNA_END=773 /DNA_ORIENTATION=-